jgi:hypothetical protein
VVYERDKLFNFIASFVSSPNKITPEGRRNQHPFLDHQKIPKSIKKFDPKA